MDDRISDLTRRSGARRDRRVGRAGMSAEVVRFISPPRRDSKAATDFPTIAFRAVVEMKDSRSARADTAPPDIVPFACVEAYLPCPGSPSPKSGRSRRSHIHDLVHDMFPCYVWLNASNCRLGGAPVCGADREYQR